MARYNSDKRHDAGMLLQNVIDEISDLQTAVRALYIIPTTITTNYTVLETDVIILNNKAATICTLTLLDPTIYPGRTIKINTWQAFGVQSVSANVIPQVGGAASTSILTTTAGKWVELVSDGTNWIIVQSN